MIMYECMYECMYVYVVCRVASAMFSVLVWGGGEGGGGEQYFQLSQLTERPKLIFVVTLP